MKPRRAIIFDIDGTLVNVDHRLHHLDNADDPKKWDKFFGEMHNDTAIEPITTLAKILHQNAINGGDCEAVLVVTARPDDNDYRKVTEDQLLALGVNYEKLYTRKGGDFRADNIVKADILDQILKDGYEPFLVIDDRPQVVEMWRSFGIVCLQCAPDEPRKSRYAGQTLFHMLVGPSGAGKSTYSATNYKPTDIVSTDELRRQLFGEGLGLRPDELARTWKYAHGLIKARLDCGVFTVLDATNLKTKDRLAALKMVPPGVFVNYIVIDRDYDTKVKDRGWRSEDLIAKHHKTFKSNLRDILAGDGQPNVIVMDKRK